MPHRNHRIAPLRKMHHQDRSKRRLLLQRKPRGKALPLQALASPRRRIPKHLAHNHRVATRIRRDHLRKARRSNSPRSPRPNRHHHHLKMPSRPRQRRRRLLSAERRHNPPPRAKKPERMADRRNLVRPRDLRRINVPGHRLGRLRTQAPNATPRRRNLNAPRHKPNHPAKARAGHPPAIKRP